MTHTFYVTYIPGPPPLARRIAAAVLDLVLTAVARVLVFAAALYAADGLGEALGVRVALAFGIALATGVLIYVTLRTFVLGPAERPGGAR